MKYITSLSLALVLLAACAEHPKSTYFTHGQPESLLDIAHERVAVSLSAPKSIDDLGKMLEKNQPQKAEISCVSANPLCDQAKALLTMYRVPAVNVPAQGADNSVALIYEKLSTRDCDNRFYSNHHNYRNRPHPTLGCSNAANMVQMVSDKYEFINPNLMDPQDAQKASQNFGKYLNGSK